jgi:tRNA (cytidine/uridine-2'-O-)-methyltransferase
MDFAGFDADRLAKRRRLALLSTWADQPYLRVAYRPDGVLMLVNESARVPELVRRRADLRARIPLPPGLRSLDLVAAAVIVPAEARRQTGGFPGDAAG